MMIVEPSVFTTSCGVMKSAGLLRFPAHHLNRIHHILFGPLQ